MIRGLEEAGLATFTRDSLGKLVGLVIEASLQAVEREVVDLSVAGFLAMWSGMTERGRWGRWVIAERRMRPHWSTPKERPLP